jgi:hypothetical protein
MEIAVLEESGEGVQLRQRRPLRLAPLQPSRIPPASPAIQS